ncbi:hypothetical protein [uncultured Alistipes sp.]|nr:hypothetical protein [uncultured Alistipes sp.]
MRANSDRTVRGFVPTQGPENEAAADAAAKVGSSYGEAQDILAYSSPS